MARNADKLQFPAPHAHGHRRRSVAVRRSLRQLARRRRASRRRGVILLVTLVLLTLFTMMLITFVVATVTSRQSITPATRVEQTGDAPDAIMHDVFLQVIRGPRNPNSPIGAHSLLEDMFGSDSMVLNIPTSTNVTQVTSTGPGLPTPLLQITWTYNVPGNPYPRPTQLPPPTGHYAGRSIMLLNGPNTGAMGRIIGSDFDGNVTHTLTIYGFSTSQFVSGGGIQRFLVNGKPFSGTGFGFKPLSFDPGPAGGPVPATYTRLLDAYYTISDGVANGWTLNMQQALLPNHRQGVFAGMIDPLDPSGGTYSQYNDPAGPGGANEDHDAPTHNDFALSMTTRDSNSMETILPSFHRPDLLMYWANTVAAVPNPAGGPTRVLLPPVNSSGSPPPDALSLKMLRKIVVRPLPWDHPNFTGSNPLMSLANLNSLPISPTHPFIAGPWDVDNDNDGETDSIWIDVGLPVQTAPDGRRYKPLVAIMVRDLDGRLNLNAHSSWRHVPSGVPQLSRFLPIQAPFAVPPGTTAQTTSGYRLRVGQGYGPAEISLSPIFSPYPGPTGETIVSGVPNVTVAQGELANILGGIPSITTTSPFSIDGRYGERDAGSVSGSPLGGAGLPGISLVDEPFSWLNESQFPRSGLVGSYQKQFPYLPLTIGTHNGPFIIDGSQITDLGFPGYPDFVWLKGSGYGSPPDLNGSGMLAFDLRGAPIYMDYTYQQGASIPDAGWGEENEAIDDPYEIDLSLNGRGGIYNAATLRQSTVPGGMPSTTMFNANALTVTGSTSNSSIDAPFTAAELERIMRAGDIDAATLPERLMLLAPNAIGGGTLPTGGALRVRQLLTTEQYDMNAPTAALVAHDMVQQISTATKQMMPGNIMPASSPLTDNTIATLLRARLWLENPTIYTGTITPAYVQRLNASIQQLLPPELLMGQKFDINRLLGNGRDDNGNGVVDEPGELETAWAELYPNPIMFDLNNDGVQDGTPDGVGTSYVDANGDGVFDARDMLPAYDANGNNTYDAGSDLYATLPRQLLARHLYVLMMLLKDPNFQVNQDLNGDNNKNAIDTAYYFAQLAINMVDFRDRDAIMTPFEFDINPFIDDDGVTINGTWDVDGVISTVKISDGTPYVSADDTAAYRGLVWGCERPELLITETMATHDRRTRDTNLDTTTKAVDRTTGSDDDFDQVRRPLGQIIIELFNPNQPLSTGNKIAGEAPNELYAQSTTPPVGSTDAAGNPLFGVNLSKLTRPDVAGRISPVWRLSTLQNTAAGKLTQRGATLSTASLDRVVHFVNLGMPNLYYEQSAKMRVFSGQPGGVIPPRTYGLVAPAAYNVYGPSPGQILMTPLGMRDTTQDSPKPYTNSPTATAPTAVVDSYPRTLLMSTSGGVQVGVNSYQVATNTYVPGLGPPDVKQTVGIWVGPIYFSGAVNGPNTILPDPKVGTATKMLRFSLTEPDCGYPIVKSILGPLPASADTGNPGNMYLFNENGYYDANAAKYPDTPYDLRQGLFQANAANVVYDSNTRYQWLNTPTKHNQTLPAVTMICLQRLANPLQPWDANANPYIIVDQMPIDLTTFNSEMQFTPASGKEEFQNEDLSTQKIVFDTRRRTPNGVPPSPLANVNVNNVWFQSSAPPTGTTPLAQMVNGGANFLAKASLGYSNNEYGVPGNPRWTTAYVPPVQFPGVASPSVNPIEYCGDPTIAFPWLNWNNRPYVSGKELMLVPTSSPSSLLRDMSLNQNSVYGAGSVNNVFQQGAAASGLPAAEFAHLTNMFDSPRTQLTANGVPDAPSAKLYRLLDYVHVPSRFSGTADWITPTNVIGPSAPASTTPGAPGHRLHPPFNQISRFRDPGRVNINTIFDPAVWQGILDERLAGESGAPWLNMYQAMWAARQGSGLTNGSNSIFGNNTTAFPARGPLLASAATANMPTIFAKPFRSAAGNSLVPLAQMRLGHVGAPSGDNNEREISSTLLRADPTVGTFPMLEAPGAPPPASGYFKEFPNVPYASSQSSPYFAYEELRRLDNLVTTRSNVYAVWITLGYFEVTPAPGAGTDPEYAVKYPDGWQLGAELGSDTGDIQRHRSFYIYDRSIPVGFERGENHNVDRGILVERYIE